MITWLRRVTAVSGVAAGVLIAGAGPAAAHGVGERGDLPLPLWIFTWSAGLAVLCSFLAFGLFWGRPHLARLAAGRPIGVVDGIVRVLAPVLRLLSLAFFVLVVLAGLFGDDRSSLNVAPWAFYIIFWVGMQAVSAVFGDVWSTLSPFDTIVAGIDWVRARLGGDPATGAAADANSASDYSRWPAVVGLFGFLWLELAYFDAASPRLIGWVLLIYTVVMVAAGVRFGRGWLRYGEAFQSWFSLLAAMAPFHRNDDGELRLRMPFSGLSEVDPVPGTVALIIVGLASTSFDGVTRQEWWNDIVGNSSKWGATLISTIAMVFVIAAFGLLYFGACHFIARVADGYDAVDAVEDFIPSLIPIALAYAVAHYFSLFVLDGQNIFVRLSDPFGDGSNWFGTTGYEVNYLLVSSAAIAWVQAGGIVVGHIAGVAAAHDRALERFEEDLVLRSQYPMVAVMVAYTVGGLFLLL